MFARLSTIVLAASVLVAAKPWGGDGTTTTVTVTAPTSTATEPASQCNTGPIQCCDQVNDISDPFTGFLLGLLDIVINDVDVLIGIGCSPISILSGGDTCDADPVCCENNNFASILDGLVAIGCVPVNVNLRK
ncbi:fungal hydrophobin [Coniophora puteana RWD-64-598 SS2]|uniref:Hydrophobin n=1 Tax=Coniophora puteana (strain RWD-64-598) TaxID=741705 RepID=A0A5M3N3B0_CONPW|nr:fungal hydrophobin [Coniophora puteana RWD-64-598 SS2]EIW85892.1 fungal hydrophobin [Coniophora puteana RWD-64-598 SS2]